MGDEPITQDDLDREIGHLRSELRSLAELVAAKDAARALALVLRTEQVEEHMDKLNDSYAQARAVAATTVDSALYESQMADVRMQLQNAKDGARNALTTAVGDLARQLASLKEQVQQDVARREGETAAISEAKAAAASADSSASGARKVSWGAVFITLLSLLWDFFFSGGGP
jgi:chromosome segregation ATPase